MAERSGGGWARPRLLTHDHSGNAAPLAAYDGSGRPALAWLAGDTVRAVVGDLGDRPVTVAGPTDGVSFALNGALVAGPGGLALVWPAAGGGVERVRLSDGSHSPPAIELKSLSAGDIRAAALPDGSLLLVGAQPHLGARGTGVPGDPTAPVDIAVATVAGSFPPVSGSAIPAIVGGAGVALLLVAAGLFLYRRRRLSRSPRA